MPGGSAGIRAGRAFVELFADPNELYRVLEDSKKRILGFAKVTAKIGVGAAGIGGALLTPIGKMFSDAVKEGADVEGLAKRFHTTAESISTLRGAFAQAGIGSEEFGSTLDSLSTKIADAATNRDELIHGLQGLRGDMLIGKGIDEQLDMIAEKFKTIKSAEDQISEANKLGLGGMLEYLKKGKAGMDELRAAAVANGDAMSGEDAKAASTIYKEFNRTMIAVKSTLISVGKALLPTGNDFAAVGADIREGLASVRNWIVNHQQVIVVVTGIAAALVGGGTAIVAFATVVATTVPVITGVILVVKGLVFVFGALMSPIGLVAIVVAGIAAGLLYLFAQTAKGQAVFADLKDSFGQLASWLGESWKGVTNAISAGDWTLAFKIGIATADVAWRTFVAALTAVWIDFKSVFVDTWESATTIIGKMIVDLSAFIYRNTMGYLNKLLDGYNSIAKEIDDSLVINISGFSDAEINKARDDIKRTMDEDAKIAKKSRDDFRKAQADGAMGLLIKAMEELRALKTEAAKAASSSISSQSASAAEKKSEKKSESTASPSFTQLYSNQKGIFGGPAEQQLGYGDNTAQRQLDAQLGTFGAVQQGNEILKRIAANSGGGVWG